ncbi:hypothetical protein DERP_007084 [Dermatophagoides pteronyssinus]|uniref:Uncharacterized protein n=1 Tax=Dermatophagoides pteronyssinus TaxID=6956 RepID=A0ABQ8JU43_DERPT|nr:hypothetical protein DERP_007084 [Dermatophagoides pteronyssinus]
MFWNMINSIRLLLITTIRTEKRKKEKFNINIDDDRNKFQAFVHTHNSTGLVSNEIVKFKIYN